jgi:hypothetical protein
VQILGVALNWTEVHYDWLLRGVNPEADVFFDWSTSAIPTHLSHVSQGRFVDIWLLEVGRIFGPTAMLLTAAVPAELLLAAGYLLFTASERRDAFRPKRQPLGFGRSWKNRETSQSAS